MAVGTKGPVDQAGARMSVKTLRQRRVGSSYKESREAAA